MDIFQKDDISDLPKSVSSMLRIGLNRSIAKKILDLFEIKNELCIDEILIGLYRIHKIEKTRAWVSATLHKLCSNKKTIQRVAGEKGCYIKINNKDA